jgi:hypothetical protein
MMAYMKITVKKQELDGYSKMIENKLNSLGRKTKILGATLAIISALGYSASASAIVFDGLLDGPDGNVSDGYATTTTVGWYNDHHSIYDKATAGDTGISYTDPQGNTSTFDQRATMAYTVGDSTLNVFVEVPDYARRLIWKNGFEYKEGDCEGTCTGLHGIDKAILDAYLLGARDEHPDDNTNPHHNSIKFDYNTQTGSEYFQLNDTGVKIKWQDESGPMADNGGTLDWITSREYYIVNDPNCSTTECILTTKTSSIELAWTGLANKAAAQALLDSFDEFQLHLSDEMRLFAPPSEVPVPAAFWLFGTALIGFIGMSRRTSLS